MFLDKYHSDEEAKIQVSRQQASDFAKEIADDFNPIHDLDAKRFCVPGDLLFALVLTKYGLSKRMDFTFSGMVGDGVSLIFPNTNAEIINVVDGGGKEYLSIKRNGDASKKQDPIRNFIRSYVEFSGHSFPHILVPLMAEHGVMINPDRPLVMYQGMSFHLERLELVNPKLELSSSSLQISKKRGNVLLEFCLTESGEVIGEGKKTMVLSGLRPYDQAKLDQLIDAYAARKLAYSG